MERRPIPGHADYLCGDDGTIWSVKRGTPKPLRLFRRGRQGHLGVNLSFHGTYVMHSVHQLVALTWIGPAPSTQHLVMHGDDDPTHNAFGNLSWGLPKENSAHMVARGRQARGERCARSKLTSTSVALIKQMLSREMKQRDIAKAFGISPATVTDIKTGRIWKDVYAD